MSKEKANAGVAPELLGKWNCATVAKYRHSIKNQTALPLLQQDTLIYLFFCLDVCKLQDTTTAMQTRVAVIISER